MKSKKNIILLGIALFLLLLFLFTLLFMNLLFQKIMAYISIPIILTIFCLFLIYMFLKNRKGNNKFLFLLKILGSIVLITSLSYFHFTYTPLYFKEVSSLFHTYSIKSILLPKSLKKGKEQEQFLKNKNKKLSDSINKQVQNRIFNKTRITRRSSENGFFV